MKQSSINTVDATLCFILNGNEIMLIMKKRGFGEGKYNGPGGKVIGSESILEGVIRETTEETGLKPLNPQKRGILDFYFGSVLLPQWKVHVYITYEFEGKLHETEEAKGEWISIDKIPYDKMWEDDQYWLPLVLNGKSLIGKFWFSEDMQKLLDYEIVEVDQVAG